MKCLKCGKEIPDYSGNAPVKKRLCSDCYKLHAPYWEKRRSVHQFLMGYLYDGDQVRALIEKENCIYWSDHYCKRTGCKHNCSEGDYSCRVKKEDAVHRSLVPKKLRKLILESGGQMLFVEQDDPRFSDEDLLEFDTFVLVKHPSMDTGIEIDADRTGDALITIYPKASKLMYDPREFIYDEFPEHVTVGTKVTSSVVDYFRVLNTPALDHDVLMQAGHPYEYMEDARTSSLRPTFLTFKKIAGNIWEHRGNCFLGEDVSATDVNKKVFEEQLAGEIE